MSFENTFTRDHREIDDLFDEFQKQKRTNLAEAMDLFQEFQKRLITHIRAEEDVLFPAYNELTDTSPDTGLIGQMREEHRLINW